MNSGSRSVKMRREDVVEEMVSLLSRTEAGGETGGENQRQSSLESEATVFVSAENTGKTTKHASPLKAIRLAVDDVLACQRRVEKLESDLLNASDSLHFNSLDMPGYKRDMSFIEDLIPIITKANTHAGCASRISANLMKSLKDYATAIKAQGSSTRSDIESIGPLLTSLSRYMSQVDEAVNEAITVVERPNASIEELRNKMKRVFIISGVMFIVLFVLFVIDTFRLSTKKISGFPVTLLILVCSMPLSVAVFMVMGLRMKFKERSIRDELEDWPLRDTALEQLKRVQPILTHFASCQTFKTMVPEIIRTQPSEFAEDWEELAEGKVSERKNDLLRDSGKGRATIEIKSLSCL